MKGQIGSPHLKNSNSNNFEINWSLDAKYAEDGEEFVKIKALYSI